MHVQSQVVAHAVRHEGAVHLEIQRRVQPAAVSVEGEGSEVGRWRGGGGEEGGGAGVRG